MSIGAPNGRDSALNAWVRALEATAPIAGNADLTLPILIDDLAEKFGASPALLSDRQSLTYGGLAERSHRYARWALGQGFAAGDVVALLMPNCPEYMAAWLGITRVGAVVALINTNLVGESLAHAITVVAPRGVIVAGDLAVAVAALGPRLPPGVRCWAFGPGANGLPRIDDELERTPGERLDGGACPLPTLADRALYIYTSGTTGLPKAATVSHFRLMQWSHWFAGMIDTGPGDRMYDCLPMYHSIGGVVATGALLVNGGSVVLRERFSPRQFWADIARWDCTLFQYIGEVCRYLVNSPPSPGEARHRIRLCCGNGLRGDVWERFKDRFRIPQILEFYAATEGNFSLYNCEGRPGAIGRIPSFLAHRFPVALVKFDVAAGEPLRDESGHCIRCAADEPGEALGRISGGGAGPGGRFEGYSDAEASDRKILRDVFVAGDAWFRTGDLMRRDRSGYFYFVDRVGDTFRWKGENVSTTEVAETIAVCPGVLEAVVYGVAVPGTEGRAGMAALVVGPDFDRAALRRHLAERLPDYARPLFLRIRGEIDVTATFKPRKQDLAEEGFDPARTADMLYFSDRTSDAFVVLDGALHRRILTGDLRF